jgi:pimeloyl-ACP methyl ester carboxylesterase
MPFQTIDGARIHFEEHGSGAPILFIHGLGSSGRDWAPQLPYFSARYRVLTCDLRGHGQSSCPPGPYAIPQFARDVAVLLREQNATPAHVVGLSMGGMVALELAAHNSNGLRSLTVVNSALDVRLKTWRDVWFYISRRFAVQVLGMKRVGERIAQRLFPDNERLQQQFVKRWATNDKQAYLHSVDAIMGWSVVDRLSCITTPTLVVSAEHDYTPVAAKNRAVARLPNAELAVVDGARHALPVEYPDRFNALLDDFLQRVSTTTQAASS